MPLPTRTCVRCGESFVLRPGKPGFANICPECSDPYEALENFVAGQSSDPDGLEFQVLRRGELIRLLSCRTIVRED